MNRWKENWEIKMMAILLAVLLWLTLRMSQSVSAPAYSPSETRHRG
ncbi:MAG: hypothetical protein IPN90_06390 [Elusimicrobia bacterium]|nr:hypothetical protein [Elusimicrobiota bacterium]